jgi:hypothetical protein
MTRKIPPAIKIISFQLISMGCPSFLKKGRVNKGSFNFIIQVMVSKRPMRNIIASKSPMVLAFFCLSGESLSEIIDIKIILSTPSTISRKVRVSKLNQTAGSEKSGNIIREFYDLPKKLYRVLKYDNYVAEKAFCNIVLWLQP